MGDDHTQSSAFTLDGERKQMCESPSLPQGAQVGRYLIIDKLGQGGMGLVYRAFDPELNRMVALKLLRPGATSDDSDEHKQKRQARLLREAQALAQLSHPNVVSVYDAGVFDGSVFVAIELVTGHDLKKWLKSSTKKVSETLAVLIAAGRGLDAAHQAGIVHRDFKPANVMVGDDGRVRVLDFGLARSCEEPNEIVESQTDKIESSSSNDLAGDLQSRSTSGLLRSSLTQVGAVVGTPAYMSPEQFSGQEVSELSDQFSFAVVAFEALYGQRPFQAKRRKDLLIQIARAEVLRPKGNAVPAWLDTVILQGLAPRPEERFESMEAFLEALLDDPAIRARAKGSRILRYTGFVGFVVSVVLAVFGWRYGATYGQRVCSVNSDRFAGFWDTASRSAISKAFAQSGRTHSKGTFKRVSHHLQQFTQNWALMHTQACEATYVHGEQSDQLLDLRVACLRRKLSKMKELTVLMRTNPTNDLIDRAVAAVIKTSSLEACANLKELTAEVPKPEDPSARAKLDILASNCDRAEALQKAGNFSEAKQIIAHVIEKVERLNFSPLEAEALFLLGKIEDQREAWDQAEQALRKAATMAAKGRSYRLLARCWTDLIWLLGYRKAQYVRALDLIHPAKVAVELASGDIQVLASLENTVGVVYHRKGDYSQAEKSYQHALQLWESISGGDQGPLAYQLASVLNNFGLTDLAQGRIQAGMDHYQRARKIWEHSLGPDHPRVGQVYINMAIALNQHRSVRKAKEYNSKALKILEAALGPTNSLVGMVHCTQAGIEMQLGDLDNAEKASRVCLSTYQKTLESGHPLISDAIFNLSVLHVKRDNFDQARQLGRQAYDIRIQALGPYHPSTVELALLLARIEMLSGNEQLAVRATQKVLDSIVTQLGEKDQTVADAQKQLGHLLLKRKKANQARQYLKKALATFQALPARTFDAAEARYLLAQTLPPTERASARSLALQARQTYGSSNLPTDQAQVKQIDHWLSSL